MITAVLSILVVVLVLFVIWQSRKPPSSGREFGLLQQQVESLRGQLAESLRCNTETVNKQLTGIIEQVNLQLNAVTGQMVSAQKTMGERLDNAARAVSDVHKGIGSLSQAAERIFEVGKDISSLQGILQAPKLRGGLGELLLGDVLA